MQLTNEIKAKIFGLYIGCEVTAPHPQEDGERLKGYLTGVHGEMEAEVQHIENGHAWEHPEYHDYNNTKLILTPLSEITDKDCDSVCKLVGYNENDRLRVRKEQGYWRGFIDLQELYEVDDCYYRDFVTHHPLNNVIQLVDFLRSRGYALPYLNIDLFESGIAIPKTKK